MEETLGNLSAFYAMFPGNQKFDVFPMWLAEDHHARLSTVFAPHLGHAYSEDLDNEYLNVFERRMRTPFFQDVYALIAADYRLSTQSRLRPVHLLSFRLWRSGRETVAPRGLAVRLPDERALPLPLNRQREMS